MIKCPKVPPKASSVLFRPLLRCSAAFVMMRLAAALGLVVAASAELGPESERCNPESEPDLDAPVPNSAHPLTGQAPTYGAAMLHTIGNGAPDDPACLDGTPYGFYFQKSATGSTKWSVSIDGGGWCYDEQDCLCRAGTSLGTNTGHKASGGCSCITPKEDGSMDADCNCIHMPVSPPLRLTRAVPAPSSETRSER